MESFSLFFHVRENYAVIDGKQDQPDAALLILLVIIQRTSDKTKSNRCWGLIPEVYVEWMPHPSLQGSINGAFWNKSPIPVTDFPAE
jgi:hypothetical protein